MDPEGSEGLAEPFLALGTGLYLSHDASLSALLGAHHQSQL